MESSSSGENPPFLATDRRNFNGSRRFSLRVTTYNVDRRVTNDFAVSRTTRWFPIFPRLARLAGFHFFHNLHDSLASIFFRNLQLAGFHLFHNLPGSRSSRSSSSSSRVLVIGTGLGSCMIVPSRPARPVFVIDLVQQHFYDVSMDYAGSESRSPIFPGTIRHFT